MLSNKEITIDNHTNTNDDASLSDNSMSMSMSNEYSKLRPRHISSGGGGGSGGGHPINILRANPTYSSIDHSDTASQNGLGPFGLRGTNGSSNNNTNTTNANTNTNSNNYNNNNNNNNNIPGDTSLYGSIMTNPGNNTNGNNSYSQGYGQGYSHGHVPVDYETLLTMALENTSRKAEIENKKKQNILFCLIAFLFLMSLCIISTVTFSEYPQEEELHDEINNLQSDIDELHSQVNDYNFQQDEDIDLLVKEIDDKRVFIDRLEEDETIDPKERETLVKAIQSEIDDLKVAVAELEKNEATASKSEHESAGESAGANTAIDEHSEHVPGEHVPAAYEHLGGSTDNGTIWLIVRLF